MVDLSEGAVMTIFASEEDSKVQIYASPTFEDPFSWGIILVDAMRILASSYAEDESATDSQPYLERIKQGLDAEFANYTSPITPIGKHKNG